MEFQSQSPGLEALQGIPRTLLIPLAARARAASLCPALDPQDQFAQAAMAATGTQVHTSPMDVPAVVNVLWRTQLIKQLGRAFFERHPQSPGVDLGAGLAHHFQWLNNGHNCWLDVDLPEVIALRRSLMPGNAPRCQHQSTDLTDNGWWQGLALPKNHPPRPTLVVCEGVLMYLQPSHVRQIIREIAHNAPVDSELLVDFMSPLGIGRALLPRIGETADAPFIWGTHNGLEIANIHPRLELLAQYSVSEAYGWMAPWAEMFWSPLTGGPLYGLAHFRVSDE
jgi:O-methyltransferase involved in polyketide biosynthesis